MRESHGLMVNYLYNMDRIVENHEKYLFEHSVISSTEIEKLAVQH